MHPPRAISRPSRAAAAALLAVALWMNPASAARAEETSAELLKAFRAAVQEEMSKAGDKREAADEGEDDDGGRRFPRGEFLRQASRLGALLGTTGRGQDPQTEGLFLEFSALGGGPEPVRRAAAALAAQLAKERTEREAARDAAVDAAVARAGETVLRAAAPKDLDPVLRELAELRSGREGGYEVNSGRGSQTAERLQSAFRFVTRWQDYLAASLNDNPQAAAQALRGLAENEGGSNVQPFIPRSELLARLQKLRGATDVDGSGGVGAARRRAAQTDAMAREIAARIQTLEEIAPALVELRRLRGESDNPNPGSGGETNFIIGALEGLEKFYRDFQAGFATSLSFATRTNSSNYGGSVVFYHPVISLLQRQLLLLVLPRALGLGGEAVRASPGEPVDALLRRLLEEAKARQDWPVAARILEALRVVGSGLDGGPYTNVAGNSESAFRTFFAGQNQDRASQWQLAVISYQNALKTGSLDLPMAYIGERLEAIRHEHPQEYEAGVNRVLNPPPPDYGPPYGPGRPNFPPMPLPAPALVVPAASPSPVPKPTPGGG